MSASTGSRPSRSTCFRILPGDTHGWKSIPWRRWTSASPQFAFDCSDQGIQNTTCPFANELAIRLTTQKSLRCRMRPAFFKTWRRKRRLQQPLKEDQRAIIERNVPYYLRITDKDRRRLEGLVQVFLYEKAFEGCGGLEITDEIRITIAAYACILLLGRDACIYPKLRSILVYPASYVAPLSRREPDGTVTEGIQARSGESWSYGNVVLSWDDVAECASGERSGRNVVLHEFAHQLDSESGTAQGAPALPDPSMYGEWARVLGAEYQALIEAAETGRPTLLDKYGATSPAEFFAVATECFFEMPAEMAMLHPELYGQLTLFYEQDPAHSQSQ